MTLTGKTAFVTGGAGGIGKATSLELLAAGANVFAIGRSQEKLDALVNEAASERLAVYRADVGVEEAVTAAFAACVERFGTVDMLVNNAGIGIPSPDLSQTDVAVFDQMMQTNVRGVFLCSREALKLMKPRRSGHILTVVSMAGQRTNPGAPLYCVSKFGARGLSGGIGDQVLAEGIRVTDINPGPVDTDYWGERKVPREKFLQPADVARAILFAVSTPEHVVIREINMDSAAWLAK
jgi:NAD(P)-dependent dehydrogenase (short-subunit alcohol dehydrogenase family)